MTNPHSSAVQGLHHLPYVGIFVALMRAIIIRAMMIALITEYSLSYSSASTFINTNNISTRMNESKFVLEV